MKPQTAPRLTKRQRKMWKPVRGCNSCVDTPVVLVSSEAGRDKATGRNYQITTYNVVGHLADSVRSFTINHNGATLAIMRLPETIESYFFIGTDELVIVTYNAIGESSNGC